MQHSTRAYITTWDTMRYFHLYCNTSRPNGAKQLLKQLYTRRVRRSANFFINEGLAEVEEEKFERIEEDKLFYDRIAALEDFIYTDFGCWSQDTEAEAEYWLGTEAESCDCFFHYNPEDSNNG